MLLFSLIIIVLSSIIFVLVLGFISLIKGNNPKHSNILMKTRVGLQFITILLLLVVMFYYGSD